MSDKTPYFYDSLTKAVAEAVAEAPLELFSEEEQAAHLDKANRILFASVPILLKEMSKDSVNTAVSEVYNGHVDNAVLLYQIGDFLARMGESISTEGLHSAAGTDE